MDTYKRQGEKSWPLAALRRQGDYGTDGSMSSLAANNNPLDAEMREQLLETQGLNFAQSCAVHHAEGPLLVIAGAGSGKTRTLVHRMAQLVRSGVAPESILLLTFTRKAAQNMLTRAAQLTGPACRKVMGGTFHATANILLRQYASHLDLNPSFTIIDRADAEGIINLLKASLGMAGANKRFPSKRLILNLLSGAVNKGLSLEELLGASYPHLFDFLEDIQSIAEHYQQFKVDHALMDYDDLLVNWRRLLMESEPARRLLSQRFHHIMVDEYQDTNHIQAHIVRLLAYQHANVMVVGDDAQSIYSFRGADFANIMQFCDQFKGARLVKLEENYRSTQPILAFTNDIIEHAEQKFAKTLFSSIQEGRMPKLAACVNEAAEARFIAERIEALRDTGMALDEMAVLFRSGFHSYKLEIELASRQLAFEKRGGLKLTESAHIKDVLSFFRVLVNPLDTLSWNRILLQLDKVGPKTAHKIVQHLREAENAFQALAAYPAASGWKGQWAKLCALFEELASSSLSPSEYFARIMEYYQPLFETIYFDDHPKRRKDLDQVQALSSGYGDIQSFVDDTTLDPPEQAIQADALAGANQRLVLSTIHSAKGLEWETVFVMGLAEGRFPHAQTLPGAQWEEERRLFYVAATRAKKQLFLTYPKEMLTSDRFPKRTVLSPLLSELRPNLYEQIQLAPTAQKTQHTAYATAQSEIMAAAAPTSSSANNSVIELQQDQAPKLQPGMRVNHAFFGPGRILQLPSRSRVEVHFDRHGSKILHLDFTRLEILP